MEHFLFCCLFAGFVLWIGTSIGDMHGYKRGQIDAINSRIFYELKTNEDKTTEWVRKPVNK